MVLYDSRLEAFWQFDGSPQRHGQPAELIVGQDREDCAFAAQAVPIVLEIIRAAASGTRHPTSANGDGSGTVTTIHRLSQASRSFRLMSDRKQSRAMTIT